MGYFLYPTRPVFVSAWSVRRVSSQVQRGVTTQVGGGILGWRRLSLVPHKLYPAGGGPWFTPAGQPACCSSRFTHFEGTPRVSGDRCSSSRLSSWGENGGLLLDPSLLGFCVGSGLANVLFACKRPGIVELLVPDPREQIDMEKVES